MPFGHPFWKEFARSFAIGLLVLFTLPLIGWQFSRSAIADDDARIVGILEKRIDAAPDLAPGDRERWLDFYRQHPPSTACDDADPRLDALREQVCARYGQLWQFQMVERASALMLAGGCAVLCVALALGVFARVNRRAQHVSFVLGWRLFTAVAVLETVLQGALLVWLSFWMLAFYTHHYSLKLIIAVAVLMLIAVGAVVTGLFRHRATDSGLEGELVREGEAPELWARVTSKSAT